MGIKILRVVYPKEAHLRAFNWCKNKLSTLIRTRVISIVMNQIWENLRKTEKPNNYENDTEKKNVIFITYSSD